MTFICTEKPKYSWVLLYCYICFITALSQICPFVHFINPSFLRHFKISWRHQHISLLKLSVYIPNWCSSLFVLGRILIWLGSTLPGIETFKNSLQIFFYMWQCKSSNFLYHIFQSIYLCHMECDMKALVLVFL